MTETENTCTYKYKDEYNLQKRCLHWSLRAKRGMGSDLCIFHAPIEVKNFKITEFWAEFEEYLEKTIVDFVAAENEFEKKIIKLDCEGFVFPETGVHLRKSFPFSVSFKNAIFTGEANFRMAIFGSSVFFTSAIFEDEANFIGTRFISFIHFIKTIFENIAYFESTVFEDYSEFDNAIFQSEVSFQKSNVQRIVKIIDTQFRSTADFRNVNTDEKKVKRKVDGETKTVTLGPGVIYFDNAHFHQPKRVLIGGEETTLKRWSFRGTNIESVKFTQENWPFKNKRKYCYDEILADETALCLEEGKNNKKEGVSKVTYKEAAEVYRKLRLNYENRLAYDEASDFHYGQMVCRFRNKKNRSWPERYILTGGYWLISKYGQSVGRPLSALLVVIALFTVLYTFVGFDFDGFDYFGVFKRTPGVIGPEDLGWWSQLLTAFIFSARNAFSMKLEGPLLTQLIAAVQKLLSATCITFFVLALRRKFKR